LNSAYTAGIIKTRVDATMNTPASRPNLEQPLDAEDFDALDTILDDLRQQDDEVPQWEFCEGALAALLCTRRLILPSEFLPVLIGVAGEAAGDEGADGEDGVRFADAAQAERFMVLWTRRWNEVANALAAEVETLEDERSYHPELLDVRGAVATMPESDRADIAPHDLPAYGQVWALGFMFVVENWSDDWTAPRDKEAAQWLDDALNSIVALTEDDTAEPTLSMHSEDGLPSVSEARLNQLGEAIWAVYDLRQIWQSLGPKTEPVRRSEAPGRNDPCWCGSGKKFKKCHGAG
jgi:uncharacterized protein